MTSHYIELCGKEVHFLEWSPGQRAEVAIDQVTTIVMWHGFARTCRDFDTIARHLSSELGYTVLCPDTIGRGLSEWTSDLEEYSLPFYLRQLASLLQLKGVDQCYFLGTSMGGLLGMIAAATALKPVVKKLVLNDVGPVVEQAALDRIVTYLKNPPICGTMTEFEAALSETYKSFGPVPPNIARRLVELSARRLPDGTITTHLDPNVVAAIKPLPPGADLWPIYDMIECPTLVIRGATSDVLLASTADAMKVRGPKADQIVVENTGHAPLLADDATIDLVSRFFC